MTKERPIETDVLNTVEAAHLLRAHIETIRRLARKGEIPAFKIGKNWRFRKDTLLRWAEKHHLRTDHPSVLVVDDEPRVLKIITTILDRSDLDVIVDTAEDGYKALLRIGQSVPDLLILDTHMPKMDGKTLLRTLKQDDRTKNIKILVATGFPDDVEEMIRLGADQVILKPFKASELLGILKQGPFYVIDESTKRD